MKRFLLVMIMLAVLGLPTIVAQEEGGPAHVGLRPDAPEYALHGPYWVGTREVVINPDSERSLPATIWYPALNPDGAEEAVVYDLGIADLLPEAWAAFQLNDYAGHALLNAQVDAAGGPYPLVIMSHGNGGTRYYGAYLYEHLASYGMVVIAPSHIGNNMRAVFLPDDVINNQLGPTTILRPQDISATITYASSLPADDPLGGMVDPEHIAVMGFANGADSALFLAGAPLDMNVFQSWCDSHPQFEARCTGILGSEDEMAAAAGLDAAPDGAWPTMTDDRIDTIVALIPAMWFTEPVDLEAISIPTLVMNGSAETMGASEDEVVAMYNHLAGEKALVTFIGGDTGVLGGDIPGPAHDFPGWAHFVYDPVWNLERSADLTSHFVTAFLLTQFFGDEAAAAALSAAAVQFPGIIYDTSGF
ncbi:MAG: hypothetical protein H6670_03845 [Anaerolineaceae bacterium]|nr:hypothetical protein [Anaerolineaceae bacterium]